MTVVSRFGAYATAEGRGNSQAFTGQFAGFRGAKVMQRHLLFLSRNWTDGAEMVPTAFRSRGWEVDIAHPTAEALASVEEQSYDLVIMEITRPGPEGFALCGVLREQSQVPLLLIVAPVAKGDVVEGLRSGADAYIVAPFDLRELVVRAEALVRRAKGRVRGLP